MAARFLPCDASYDGRAELTSFKGHRGAVKGAYRSGEAAVSNTGIGCHVGRIVGSPSIPPTNLVQDLRVLLYNLPQVDIKILSRHPKPSTSLCDGRPRALSPDAGSRSQRF